MIFNPFTSEFLKLTHPSLYLDTSIVANRGLVKINNRIANSVDPDETAHYEPSHLDLHCLQRYLYWSVEMKGLRDRFLLVSDRWCSTVVQRWCLLSRRSEQTKEIGKGTYTVRYVVVITDFNQALGLII